MTSILLRHHVPVPDDALLNVVEPPAPAIDRADTAWYKDAIIYQLHIKAFKDANNDGVGDFRGLMSQLDYVQQLGVTAIWLLPFYPSPLRDDGYDISDYTSVHPSYGSIEDFKNFVDAAHQRGIRVITELVINHTSDSIRGSSVRARRRPARRSGISMSGAIRTSSTKVRGSYSSTARPPTGRGIPSQKLITGIASIRISRI